MFKTRIKDAAKARGVKTYYQLGQLLDTANTGEVKFVMLARRLWNASNVPTLPTLAAVCDALDCELSDLVVRVSAKKPEKKRNQRNNGTRAR